MTGLFPEVHTGWDYDGDWVSLRPNGVAKFPAFSVVLFLEHPTRPEITRASIYTLGLEPEWHHVAGHHGKSWARSLRQRVEEALDEMRNQRIEWLVARDSDDSEPSPDP